MYYAGPFDGGGSFGSPPPKPTPPRALRAAAPYDPSDRLWPFWAGVCLILLAFAAAVVTLCVVLLGIGAHVNGYAALKHVEVALAIGIVSAALGLVGLVLVRLSRAPGLI